MVGIIGITEVTCDLIPLAVLKLAKMFRNGKSDTHVTCDLIPLAVLKRAILCDRNDIVTESHVTSYRLRY